MKLLAGCVVSAGLAFTAWSANAQMLAPGQSLYRTVSDFEEPYGGMPPPPPPAYGPPPYGAPAYAPAPYGYEPVLPPREVYAVLRENGFLPLGIPRRQGYLYEISAMDPDGTDGELMIDGHNGRIIRFRPAYTMGRGHDVDPHGIYGAQAALPPPTVIRGSIPRPPAPIPHVTSRAVPLPAPKPAVAAVVQPQATVATAPPVTAGSTTVGEAAKPVSPVPVIRPTETMPAVQGLE